MGMLGYGRHEVPLDDADLSLFEVVVFVMHERASSFLVSITTDDERRLSFWVHPGAPLRFEYDERTEPDAVDAWHLDLMVACADSVDGVQLQAA